MRIIGLLVIVAILAMPPLQVRGAEDSDCPQETGDCVLFEDGTEVVGAFAPSMTKIGFMTPDTTGTRGEQIEWIITVRNDSPAAGENITITDELSAAFRIDRAETTTGTATIDAQTVIVTIPQMAPGEVARISIFTTIIEDDVPFDNTACIAAVDTSDICASGQVITQLPATGETPLYRLLLELVAGMGLVLAGLLLTVYSASTLVERR